MSEMTRSGGQADTVRRGAARRVLGAVAMGVLVAVAGSGYLDATHEVRVPHGVHLAAASGLGGQSNADSANGSDCCSEEGPSAAPGKKSAS